MVNLKVFTEYSFDKSIIKFDDYTKHILKNNLPYISVSDDNFKSLYKTKKFVEKNPSVTPIIGQEFVVQGLDFYIIAKNNKGLSDLIKFSNFKKKTLKFILKKQHNFIVFLGKPTKKFIKILLEEENKLKKALEGINFYSLLYPERGSNIFYNNLMKEKFSNKTIKVSNVVYLKEDDKPAYKNYIDIMGYDLLQDISYFKHNSSIFFLEEIEVNLNYFLNEDFKPKFDFDETLRIKQLINKKVKRVKNEKAKNIIIKRLSKELDLIEQKKFSGFIYVIYDLINFMKKNKILYNNRGSAGSSMVLYLLDIVLLNPLKYEFYFERFINEFRNELPDIDLDVQEDRIQEVVNYLINKYSKNNIGKIISYSEFQFKSLTRYVLSSINVESSKITKITAKMINKYNNKILTYDLLKDIVSNKSKYNLSDEEYDKYNDFYEYINRLFKYYPKLYTSLKLIGNIYQQSRHSSGLIICNSSIKTTFPMVDKDGIYNIQFDKKDIEDIKVIKLDLLNSIILKVISNTMKKSKLPYQWFYKKDLGDPLIYEEFSNLNTQGIFQFSSYTGKKVLEGSEVISFQDLYNRNACNRPGPLSKIPGKDKTLVETYFENKDSKKKFNTFGGILKDTYGCLIFQEQILKISQKIAGYSLSEADQKVRKNLSSKNIEKIKSIKKDFIQSSIENDFTKKLGESTFNYLVNFSKYSFNKPHAAIYSFVAYKTMELKINHRENYLNEYLKHSTRNEIKDILYETGNKILPININHSKFNTIITKDKNYIGFDIIKGFSKEDYVKIINTRPIHSISMLKGILTDKKIQKLIKAGAFDCFNENRYVLMNEFLNYEIYKPEEYDFYQKITLDKETKGINFIDDFSDLPENVKDNDYIKLKGVIDFINITKDKNENEYIKMKVLLNNQDANVMVFNEKYLEYKEQIEKGKVIDFEGYYNKKFNNISLQKII